MLRAPSMSAMTAATSSVPTMGFANWEKNRFTQLGFGGGGSSFLPCVAIRARASSSVSPFWGLAPKRATTSPMVATCKRGPGTAVLLEEGAGAFAATNEGVSRMGQRPIFFCS